jgi:ribosomal protein L27
MKFSKVASEASLKTRNVRLLVVSATSGTLLLSLLTLGPRGYAQSPSASSPAAKAASPEPPLSAPRGVTVPAIHGVELKAMINGQGPFDAIFDTGSLNMMTASLAKRLGLKLEGSGTVTAGGANVAAQGVKVKTVNIGALSMEDQTFAVADTGVGEGQDGIFVGFELLQALPIRVDFENSRLPFMMRKASTTRAMAMPSQSSFKMGFSSQRAA